MRRLPALLLIVTACEPAPFQTLLPVTDGPHQPELMAVEPGAARVWVAHAALPTRTHLTAIDVDTGKSTHVLDISAARDPRIVFPSPGKALLVVGRDGTNTFVPIDTTRLAPGPVKTISSQLWELRLSPSGRHLAAMNYVTQGLPTIDVFDTTSLEKATLPHEATELTVAAWGHSSESLVTANFAGEVSHPTLDSQRYVPPFATPDTTIATSGFEEALFASPSQWRAPIVTSPNDRWAAALGSRRSGDGFAGFVVLFDQATVSRREVPGFGPVVFASDSLSAIATSFTDAGAPVLVAIPLVSGDPYQVRPPVSVSPSTQVLIDDSGHHFVLATAATGDRALLVYDFATGSVKRVERPATRTIDSYAFEPDGSALWLVEDFRLYRVDFAAARLDWVDSVNATAVALLPGKRLIAVAADGDGVVAFVDLDRRELVRRVVLTAPTETSAPALTF